LHTFSKFTHLLIFVCGSHISPLPHPTPPTHDPDRPRRLLMHKRELLRLRAKVQEKGLTIVPARLYFKGGRAKLEIALAKGKRLFDKREAVKKKELRRELERVVKKARR
jgi:SsrA-binding protein